MLEPHDRTLLFDILKPPEDHTLDVAVATTYTLDLLALLTAPVAFSLFDVDDHNDLLDRDSLTLLESLRRYADRITVFCHAGHIGLPKAQFPQFEFLERCIVECQPRVPSAAFHSKLWVLRFLGPEARVTYRFACLSRNLTFDRCWDTALTLEGPLLDRQRAIAINHPLGDFLRALPGLATGTVADLVRQRVATVEAEVRRVQFSAPEGFDSYAFHSFGTEGASGFPFDDRPGRMLIVSPFASDGGLQRLVDGRERTLLASRPETLNQPTCRFDGVERFYVLSNGTEDETESAEENTGVDLTRGLHAKCYVVDSGAKAHVFTGSANATASAFNVNVEFLVELVGSKTRYGIDALFKREDDKTCVGDLLEEFTRKPESPDPDEDGFRAAIERTRQLLVGARFSATVTEADGAFSIRLAAEQGLNALEGEVTLVCWPVTLGKGWAKELTSDGREVSFDGLSLEALTGFIAFELSCGKPVRTEVFVLNVPLLNAPSDRRERLLRSFIKDRGRLLRFLLFLLAEDSELADAMGSKTLVPGAADGQNAALSNGALLESLLRTLHRAPQRLDAVARLVDDMRRDAEGRELLPPAFETIWDPIWAARLGGQQ